MEVLDSNDAARIWRGVGGKFNETCMKWDKTIKKVHVK